MGLGAWVANTAAVASRRVASVGLLGLAFGRDSGTGPTCAHVHVCVW